MVLRMLVGEIVGLQAYRISLAGLLAAIQGRLQLDAGAGETSQLRCFDLMFPWLGAGGCCGQYGPT
jgi:hypothetical protein